MIPTLAITVGDPAGIGPEIALKAVRALQARLDAGEFRLRLVACPAIMDRIGGMLDLAVPPLTPEDKADAPVGIWAIGGDPGAVTIGEVSAEGGRQA